jgi:hypothetical protein
MTATASRSTTTSDTTARRARLAMAGAALWVLMPIAFTAVSLEDHDFGSLRFIAVAASDWLFAVAPPLLLVVGHLALRASLGPNAGRIGALGIAVAATGLGAIALGNGVEIASFSAGGDEVAIGHVIFLLGFLVSVVGALLVGITVLRRRRDGLSRAAGWVLILAVPLGIAIGVAGGLLLPDTDLGFWAAITVPTGLGWLLLSRSLGTGHRTNVGS